MNVEMILHNKGRAVVTVSTNGTVEEAVEMLRDHGIGALVVSDDGTHVDGILSERDIVDALGRFGEALLPRPVGSVMTRAVVTCDPDESVAELMAEMTNRRIRHLPVVQDGRLCGIVSIGDLVKSRLDEIEFEARSLPSFLTGGG